MDMIAMLNGLGQLPGPVNTAYEFKGPMAPVYRRATLQAAPPEAPAMSPMTAGVAGLVVGALLGWFAAKK